MVCWYCGRARHHDEIQPAKGVLPEAKIFPDQALDTIAIDGVADVAFGNYQPESRIGFTIAACKYG